MAQQDSMQDLDALMFAFGAAFLGIIIVGYFYPHVFLTPWAVVKLGEASIGIGIYEYVLDQQGSNYRVIYDHLKNLPFEELNYSLFWEIETAMMELTRWLYGVIFLLLFLFVNDRTLPTHTHTFESLLEEQSEIWAFNRFFMAFNPSKHPDLTKGKWAGRMKPDQFARAHKLLYRKKTDPSDYRRLNTTKAQQLFTQQLGRPYHSLGRLRPYERWLAAACIARILRDNESSDELLNTIGRAYNKEVKWKEVTRQTDEILERGAGNADVQKFEKQHAYVATFLFRLLIASRETGVNQTARMPWLKIKDRSLFYMMNDPFVLGEEKESHIRGCAEAGGARSHFLAEMHAGVRLDEPFIQPAVAGLYNDLYDTGTITDLDAAHSNDHPQQPA